MVCWTSPKGPPSIAVPAHSGINRIMGGWWGRYCGLSPSGATQCWERDGAAAPEAPGSKFVSFTAGWQQACGVED